MIIAVTGHRPDRLWGYNLSHSKYKELSSLMYNFLEKNNAIYCISGMALGVDTVFAITSIKYRNNNPSKNIIVECAIPCRNHTSKWQQEDKLRYLRMIEEADIITKVSNESYQPWLMQKRNEYMVDKCELLLGIWNGSKGGTGNCINYAKKKNREIHIINPKEI